MLYWLNYFLSRLKHKHDIGFVKPFFSIKNYFWKLTFRSRLCLPPPSLDIKFYGWNNFDIKNILANSVIEHAWSLIAWSFRISYWEFLLYPSCWIISMIIFNFENQQNLWRIWLRTYGNSSRKRLRRSEIYKIEFQYFQQTYHVSLPTNL